jgi:hypothetical protein
MRSADWIVRIAYGCVAFVAVLIVFIVGDIALGSKLTLDCRVIERHYQAARDDVGLATSIDSNGNPVTSMVTSYSPEQFTLLIEVEGGVRSRSVWPAEYANARPGKTLPIRFIRGAISGVLW